MNTVLPYTKLLSETAFYSDMVGRFRIHHLTAAADNLVLTCKTGDFPAVRHNEVRDITATLVTKVCHGVTTEPHLQPLSEESLSHCSASTQDGA